MKSLVAMLMIKSEIFRVQNGRQIQTETLFASAGV